MKLRRRPKPKKAQALDVVASAVKGVSEMHLAKRTGQTVAEGATKAKRLKGIVKSTPARILGAVALVGGAGAVIAKKLKGGDPEPIYTPPAPAEPMAVAPAAEIAAVEESAAAAAAEPESVLAAPELAVAPEPDALAEPTGLDAPAAEPAGLDALDAPTEEPAGLEALDAPAAETTAGLEALDAPAAETIAEPQTPEPEPATPVEPVTEASDETPADPEAAATEPPGEAAEEPVSDNDKPTADTETWRT